jgi:drug/metabolite transporter (DMT)-like permease
MALALAQLAASMILTGANVVVGKLLAAALPVPLVLFLRCLIACAVLAPLAAVTRPRARPTPAAALNLVLQATLGTVAYNIALLAGLRRTGALEAGLVLASMPAVVALGAALLLGERLSPRRAIAAGIAAVGMMALAMGRGGGAPGTLGGDALVFVAVLGEAAYMLLAKRNAVRIGVVPAALWMQVASVILLAPLALPDLAGHIGALAAPRLLALLIFHAVTASVLSVLLWYGGMRRAPAHVAGIFGILLPATAAVLAIVVLGETLSAPLAAGFVLMAASILLATWPGRRAAGG